MLSVGASRPSPCPAQHGTRDDIGRSGGMAQKTHKKKRGARVNHARRDRAIIAATAVSALAAGLGAALGLGWFDRFLPKRNAEHDAPDLAAGAATPGTDRAPDAFRPDPTAAVPASEREGLRPATGPAPSMAATRGDMANQTGIGG